ncbi:hypothetical protein ABZ650_25160 [Streptomyces griseoviridis]|uniref:hypothetical protein n=1 Tax=Streptomyces griseoviridis TaxID=45398 RepID=UPI0033CB94D6
MLQQPTRPPNGRTPSRTRLAPHLDDIAPHTPGPTPHLLGLTTDTPGRTPHLPNVAPHTPSPTPHLHGLTTDTPGRTPHLPNVTPRTPGPATSTPHPAPTGSRPSHATSLPEPTVSRPTPALSRLARSVVFAAGLAVLPLTAGCDGGGSEPAGKGRQSATAAPVISALEAQVVAPAKVEVIAGLTGCEVKIRTEAAELREGVCHTGDGDYLITTFPEERFKETWLDTISMYQGTYLMGSRWVVSAQPKALEEFRGTLGGTIVHHSGVGPSAASSP